MQAADNAETALVGFLLSREHLRITRALKLQYSGQLEIQAMPIRQSQLLIAELSQSTIIQRIIAAP